MQLLARAAGAWVGPLPVPEIGWFDVELTAAGVDDPVLGALPRTFSALQWHHYTYGVPEGAVELARSEACTQAFRLGEACWGVQFHPEVTQSQLDGWIVDTTDPPPDPDRLRAETVEHIAQLERSSAARSAPRSSTPPRASSIAQPDLQAPGAPAPAT